MRAIPRGRPLLLAPTLAAVVCTGVRAHASESARAAEVAHAAEVARAAEPASGPAAPRGSRPAALVARASEPAAPAEGWTDLLDHAVGRYRLRAWRADRDGTFAAFPANQLPFAPAYAGARLVAAVRSRGARLNLHRWLSFGLTEVAAMAAVTVRAGGAPPARDVLKGLAIGHAWGAGVAVAQPAIGRARLGAILVSPTSVSWSGFF